MASIFGNTIIQTMEEQSSLDNVINKIIDKSYNIELNAFYRAIVANNVDPLKLGRIQVRVPGIHGTSATTIQTPTSSLPWAAPGIWNCAGNDMGQYLVPEVGTVVFVTFEQGDQTKPIYFGGVSNQIGNTTKYIVNSNNINRGESYEVTTNDYPEDLKSVHDKLLFKSAKGNEVVSSDLDGQEYMYLVDASGQSIEMENFGPYLKRRGTDLGYSGKPRMKLSTNRGSDVVLTNESEILTSRQLQGQLDDIKILNKTDDLTEINGQLDKLLRDKFKDFGNYFYNKDDKVFNLDLKLNDILDLTTTTDKVYDYVVKIFNEFEFTRGLFFQVNLVERSANRVRALINYRNTNYNSITLDEDFDIYFVNYEEIVPFTVHVENIFNLNLGANTEGNFYVSIDSTDVYNYKETWGFDYRKEFRFIVDTTQIPLNDVFTMTFQGNFTGYIEKIDWGDNTQDTFIEQQLIYSHDYKEAGSYLMTWYASSIDFLVPYFLDSKGIVSIESPVPYCEVLSAQPNIHKYGCYPGVGGRDKSTLVHINKYLFRNYLLRSKEINLDYAFSYCNELKEIPYGLLEGFETIKGLEATFYLCESLRSIPEDLLEDKDLSQIDSLSYTFAGCSSLELLPEFLFINNTFENVEEIEFMFADSALLKLPKSLLHSMKNLLRINYMFKGCKNLTYIPKDLFIKNRELTVAGHVFEGCTSLVEIPRNLFIYNTKITSLEAVFKDCTNLKEIYSDMFISMTTLQSLNSAFRDSGIERIIKVKGGLISNIGRLGSLDLSQMFYGCTKLCIQEKDLLDYDIDKILPSPISMASFMFRTTFNGVGTSTLPPLWNITNITVYGSAFSGSGNNGTTITNYSSIPAGWK